MRRAWCVALIALSVACWAKGPTCSPADWNEPASIAAMLTVKEQEWGLPRGIAHCQAYVESRFNPMALSSDKQDRGLDQINLYWQGELVWRYFREPDGTRRYGFDWRNPEHSATVGCAYLSAMIRNYGGSAWLGLVAYNWGPGKLSSIEKWSDIPVKKRKYADDILELLDQWSPGWANQEGKR